MALYYFNTHTSWKINSGSKSLLFSKIYLYLYLSSKALDQYSNSFIQYVFILFIKKNLKRKSEKSEVAYGSGIIRKEKSMPSPLEWYSRTNWFGCLTEAQCLELPSLLWNVAPCEHMLGMLTAWATVLISVSTFSDLLGETNSNVLKILAMSSLKRTYNWDPSRDDLS